VAAGGSSSGASLNGGSGIVLMVAGTGNDDSGGKPADQVVTSLPPGLQQTEIGGYKLGERIQAGVGTGGNAGGAASVGAGGSGGAPGGDCGNVLLGVVRLQGRERERSRRLRDERDSGRRHAAP
jgi:hypothetical protein